MRKVAIIGIGQTPVREHWDFPIRQLGVFAIVSAMDDAGIQSADGLFVGNMLSGALSEQEHLGTLIADYAGLEGIEAVKVEAACASGGAAFRQAMLAVASGQMECAIAVGVEKLTEFSGKRSTAALASAADADYETSVGLSFAAINALMMQRFMYEYKLEKKDFAAFPINAHRNARHNHDAMFHNAITMDQYVKAKVIADPINLLDSSPIADGAAAVVIVPLNNTANYQHRGIEVTACEIATDSVSLDNRRDPVWLDAVEKSARKAYQTSGLKPQDIDLFEPHDAFSIITALSLEASGFAEKGRAVHLANDGHFAIDGQLPICTFGGLKGRGHPVGATGIYQIVEVVRQFRGQTSPAIRVAGLKNAMTQNIGGSGATVVTTILRRKD